MVAKYGDHGTDRRSLSGRLSPQYSELAMGVFGEATYEAGVLKDIYLDFEDLSLYNYNYDEEKDCYTFEDNLFENDIEILEVLLERKKAQRHNPSGLKR